MVHSTHSIGPDSLRTPAQKIFFLKAIAEQHGLRGYDAMQLAAECEVHVRYLAAALPAITFISADTELNTAAIAEGMTIEDPNAHA